MKLLGIVILGAGLFAIMALFFPLSSAGDLHVRLSKLDGLVVFLWLLPLALVALGILILNEKITPPVVLLIILGLGGAGLTWSGISQALDVVGFMASEHYGVGAALLYGLKGSGKIQVSDPCIGSGGITMAIAYLITATAALVFKLMGDRA